MRKYDDVAEHVARNIERAAESVNIAFDGAVHAETIAAEEDIAFDDFGRGNFGVLAFAEFCRGGAGGQEHYAAHTSEQHGQHGAASQPAAQNHCGKCSERNQRQNFHQ